MAKKSYRKQRVRSLEEEPPEVELPYVYLYEIYELFGYSSLNSAYVAICKGLFPIHTYRIGNRRVADREAVRAFFRSHREAAAKSMGGRVVET